MPVGFIVFFGFLAIFWAFIVWAFMTHREPKTEWFMTTRYLYLYAGWGGLIMSVSFVLIGIVQNIK